MIGFAAPWWLQRYEGRRLGLDLPLGKRVSGAAFWGVIYTIVSFAFCIDIARVPINNVWGLVILVMSVLTSPFSMWVRSLGKPVWVSGEEYYTDAAQNHEQEHQPKGTRNKDFMAEYVVKPVKRLLDRFKRPIGPGI